MTKVITKESDVEKQNLIDDQTEDDIAQVSRRSFLGTVAGAAGVGAAVSTGILVPTEVEARTAGTSSVFPGMRPANIDKVREFPDYDGDWTQLGEKPFGGFDFALCYMAEGVQGIDPESPNFPNGALSNTSGLFEQHTLQVAGSPLPIAADTGEQLMPIPSAVGGNESALRSAEFWSRDILGQSNQAIADDIWGAINWHRRVWGLDFDDPAADGFDAFGVYTHQYPGSPDPSNEASLFSPRYAVAFDDEGNVKGFARFAPTLLAPDTAYTVVARAGKKNPSYTGGIDVNGIPTKTTAASPEWPGKVRDGGFWGGVVEPMDILSDLQAVSRGERYFSTPDNPLPPLSGSTPPSLDKRGAHGGTTTNPQGTGPKWGQWWRRVAHIVNIDVDYPGLLAMSPSIDAVQDVRTAANMDLTIPFSGGVLARPAARPGWPIGYFPRGTDMFWGNYNLKFGTDETPITLHYQSEVPTAFRPSDGVPEAFPCDLCPNPSSTEINTRGDMDSNGGIQLFDSTGEISGFADRSNPELDGQMPADMVGAGQYGRVHGTSYPRSKRADGAVTYHFRNYLLWPPRLNVTSLGDPTQTNFGNANWTIPTLGDFAEENPFPIGAFN